MIELRDYQREAVNAIYDYFKSGKTGNPLIVAPTASGKSILLGKFMEEVVKTWPSQRILCLAHRKELLEQNFSKLLKLWPEAPVGIYSAGLKSKQLRRNITIAGINSIYKKADRVGWIDLILIDECHLVPAHDEGMYRKLIEDLKKINKNLKVIGFTATPFRMKTGMLTEDGGIFTDIAYEIEVTHLIKQGWIAPLVSKQPKTQADLSNVHIRGGEYVAAEAEIAMDDEALTQAAIVEMETYLANRKSWIVFCAGVNHAKHVCSALNERGHSSEVVIGDSDDIFRSATLAKFKRGEIKCLINCQVLTTGFDAPNIDAIVLLRPTQSVGLYIQMLGRGMRLSPETGKVDCIVLDFAGNIERHGPIDNIKIERRRSNGSKSEISTAPIKSCPVCATVVAISVRVCPSCFFEFTIDRPRHETTASTAPVIASLEPPKEYLVHYIEYSEHKKEGKSPSLKVTYFVEQEGMGNLQQNRISEWICLEHRGFAYQKAVQWWLESHYLYKTPEEIVIPLSIEDALSQVNFLRPVIKIIAQSDGKFDRILAREFGTFDESILMSESNAADLITTGFEDYDDIPF